MTARVGVIGRAERRGLGVMLSEFARHYQPDKVLLIRPQSSIDAGLPQFPEWYDEERTTRLTWNGHWLDEVAVRRWLHDLDVVYLGETAYDWKLCDWARDQGVRTVCHAMPEFWPFHAHPEWSRPDLVWVPTAWRLDHMPMGTEVVPVPIALDRFPSREIDASGPVRWLHVVGSRAPADRNGTRVFLEACKYLEAEQTVIIRSQGDSFYPVGGTGRNVHVEVHSTDLTDYWDLYASADGLVFPRRYGGLSLVAQEAMAAGLALVMPDVEPQRSSWPIVPIVAPFENAITTSAGSIPICAPDPKDLAHTMDWLSRHRGSLAVEQKRARACAEELSWERLLPVYRAAFERACA